MCDDVKSNQSLTNLLQYLSRVLLNQLMYTNEPSSGRLLNVTSQLHGKGKIKTYHVFPGVEMSYISLLTDQATYSHVPDEWVLEINYSILGRIGWHMERGETIYLGPGDFSIHPRDFVQIQR